MTFPHSIQLARNPEEAAPRAASLLAGEIAADPRIVVGLATGGSMRAVYDDLIEQGRTGVLDLGALRAFNLDEYLGLAGSDPNAYAFEMRSVFFGPAGIDLARTDIPRGDAPDPVAEAERYEASIRAAGGIDRQLLGLGTNGHIGFNEPGSSFASRTRVVDLAPDTRTANARYFPPGREVPTQAITMGIATILEARRIVLLATGPAKAAAVAAMIAGPRHPDCPASALQAHPHVDVILDVASAAALPA